MNLDIIVEVCVDFILFIELICRCFRFQKFTESITATQTIHGASAPANGGSLGIFHFREGKVKVN